MNVDKILKKIEEVEINLKRLNQMIRNYETKKIEEEIVLSKLKGTLLEMFLERIKWKISVKQEDGL